ncbi:MAG: chlorite dismutase family protein [Solirubrobacterales bacterium]
MAGQSFVKFTFFKVDPAWRRRLPEERTRDKSEFAAACNDFATDDFLRAYSTVGTKGSADLLLWTASPNLDHIHELHVLLNQSGLLRHAEISYSFLAMTKDSPYSDEDRTKIHPGSGKYLFVYPFVKTRDWYLLDLEERKRVMMEHIKVGREYPHINLNTSYSFGLDDQDFVLSFEADEPADFLDLVQRLRETESSRYTARDTPMFTCISTSVEKALNALDGQAPVPEPAPING